MIGDQLVATQPKDFSFNHFFNDIFSRRVSSLYTHIFFILSFKLHSKWKNTWKKGRSASFFIGDQFVTNERKTFSFRSIFFIDFFTSCFYIIHVLLAYFLFKLRSKWKNTWKKGRNARSVQFHSKWKNAWKKGEEEKVDWFFFRFSPISVSFSLLFVYGVFLWKNFFVLWQKTYVFLVYRNWNAERMSWKKTSTWKRCSRRPTGWLSIWRSVSSSPPHLPWYSSLILLSLCKILMFNVFRIATLRKRVWSIIIISRLFAMARSQSLNRCLYLSFYHCYLYNTSVKLRLDQPMRTK